MACLSAGDEEKCEKWCERRHFRTYIPCKKILLLSPLPLFKSLPDSF